MTTERAATGDHLGNDGKLPTIKWKGKDYAVSYYCPAATDLIEKEIARDSIAVALSLKDIDPGIVESTRRKLLKREHSVGGELWSDAFKKPAGTALIFWACIALNHPEFTVEDALKLMKEKDDEVAMIYTLVLPSFFVQISASVGLPVEELTAEFEKLKAIHSTPTEAST